MLKQSLHQICTHLKVCVIVPTYNNHKTLKRVLDGVLEQVTDVIVVNDGSTDTTSKILETYPTITVVTIPKNKGKGNALRKGFEKARALGFLFAITIDSDGQHYPEEIPVFIEALNNEPSKNVLFIGSRNMNQDSVPTKSSFGNKFSNFWYWFETGIKLSDTQSGFRLYPLQPLESIPFYTTKFEFEIEVIVKAAWRGVEVKNVPVHVKYDPNERVSHFRPFKDFTRISILNTWLVIVTIFYITPRNLFRKLKKKGIKKFFVEDFLSTNDAPSVKGLSVALGVFIGLSPFWGFHTLLVISLAVIFRLNKAIAFAFSNVSLPPFIPFVLYASLQFGNFILGEHKSFEIETMVDNFEMISHLKMYLIGSFSLATIMAIIMGTLGYLFFKIIDKRYSV